MNVGGGFTGNRAPVSPPRRFISLLCAIYGVEIPRGLKSRLYVIFMTPAMGYAYVCILFPTPVPQGYRPLLNAFRRGAL
jgi:hypothetical protein